MRRGFLVIVVGMAISLTGCAGGRSMFSRGFQRGPTEMEFSDDASAMTGGLPAGDLNNLKRRSGGS